MWIREVSEVVVIVFVSDNENLKSQYNFGVRNLDFGNGLFGFKFRFVYLQMFDSGR